MKLEFKDIPNHPTKQDAGKLRYDLVPYDALDKVVEVLTKGLVKYPKPEQQWFNCPPEELHRYKAAMGRHFSEYMQGKVIDKETNTPVLANMIATGLMVLALDLRRKNYLIKSDEEFERIINDSLN